MGLTSLPDEVKELVRDQFEAGHFESVDEVVCEALRLLHEREELFASHREELRAQIVEGVAAEERGELRGGAEAIADVRRRIDARLRRGGRQPGSSSPAVGVTSNPAGTGVVGHPYGGWRSCSGCS